MIATQGVDFTQKAHAAAILPPTQQIREKLAEYARESKYLRRILRIRRDIDRDAQNRGEVIANAS